jgi:hypothetical protein
MSSMSDPPKETLLISSLWSKGVMEKFLEQEKATLEKMLADMEARPQGIINMRVPTEGMTVAAGSETDRARSFVERYVIERAGKFEGNDPRKDAWACIQEGMTIYSQIETIARQKFDPRITAGVGASVGAGQTGPALPSRQQYLGVEEELKRLSPMTPRPAVNSKKWTGFNHKRR